MWFRRKYPVPFETYRLRTPVNKKELESSIRWAILDFETTGFNLHKDRILSAAITLVENGEFPMHSFQSWYVYQDLSEVNEATKIHVGGLPSNFQKDELLTLFKDCGTIKDELFIRKATFSFAFLTFENQ